jgi:hypothetical protein
LSLLHAYRLQHNLRRFALSRPEHFSRESQGGRIWDRAVISHVLPVPSASCVKVYACDDGRVRYSSLLDANSWRSPVSAYYKSIELARRLEHCTAVAASRGFSPVMVTLTLRHSRADSLPSVLDLLRQAWRYFSGGVWWQAHRPSLPVVRRLEITYSAANGWHPHLHLLCFFPSDAAPDLAAWRDRWLAAVRRFGGDALPDVAFHASIGGGALSSYVSKLHLEFSMTHSKRGGLSIYHMLDNPRAYEAQIIEFYAATHGTRFTGGVSQLMAALGVTDEDIPEEAAAWNLVLSLDVDQYLWLVEHDLAVDFLTHCLLVPSPSFVDYLASLPS